MSVDISAKDSQNESMIISKINNPNVKNASSAVQDPLQPAMAILGKTSAMLKDVISEVEIREHQKVMMNQSMLNEKRLGSSYAADRQ